MFHVLAALAEFDRDLIREGTAAGLAAARARGRHGGRPSVLSGHKLQVAQDMYRSGRPRSAAMATTLGGSRASIDRHLSDWPAEPSRPPERAARLSGHAGPGSGPMARPWRHDGEVPEVDDDQLAARWRLRAVLGFVEVVEVIGHDWDDDPIGPPGEPIEGAAMADPGRMGP